MKKQKTAAKAEKPLDPNRVTFIHKLTNDETSEAIAYAYEEYEPKEWRSVLVFYSKLKDKPATVERTDCIRALDWWREAEGLEDRWGLDSDFQTHARREFLATVSELLIELRHMPGKARPTLLGAFR